MANINEILARAAALRDETALNSISPERAGGIMYDTLLALNELWLQQGAALVISKIYASVAAMEADTAPVSDLTGKPLRPGQIVVIASSDSDNGSVYRYNGTESPSWSLVGFIGNLEPVDSLDSDSTTLPLAAHQGKVLDGKISQLGQQLPFLHIEYDAPAFDIAGFINADGSMSTNPPAGYYVTDYIPIYQDNIVSLRICALMSNQYGGGIAFYDENKTFISNIYHIIEPESSTRDNEYDVSLENIPVEAKYIRVCTYNNETNVPYVKIAYDNNVNRQLLEILPLAPYTNKLINLLDENGRIVYNLKIDDFVMDNKFIEPDGKIVTNTSYFTTDFLPIIGMISCNVVALMRNAYGGGIAFYDKNKSFIGSIYNVSQPTRENNVDYELNAQDIPSGAYFIKVQGRKITSETIVSPSVELVTNQYGLLNALLETTPKQNVLSAYVIALNNSGNISIPMTPQTKNGYVIGAAMGVTSMGKIRIDKGELEWRAGIIEIDDTYLYVYDPINPTGTPTQYEHGLVISDFLYVQIVVALNAARVARPPYYAKVRITTNDSQSYEKEIAWIGCSGNVKLTAIGGNYTDIHLTMNGKAFSRDVWLFGDSYTDMWCPYASEMGAYNYMIDGKSGRGSAEAYQSLTYALKVGTPKAILWAMGMNNGDTDVVNQSWLDVFNLVKALCAEKGIQLIPFTIPNTPTVTNYYKNNIIKNSGLFYVDVAKAVGAEAIGSSWYSGLLSGDNVHPTDKGSLVIANYVVARIPSLFI